MSTNLTDLIRACREAMPGNDDFILHAYGEVWQAEIGNTSNSSVAIGEIGGDFEASGATPEEAVSRLLELVRKRGDAPPNSTDQALSREWDTSKIQAGAIRADRIVPLDEWPENTPEERAVKEEFRQVSDELYAEAARRASRRC